MGSPGVSTRPQIDHRHIPELRGLSRVQSYCLLLLPSLMRLGLVLSTMSEPSKTEMTHIERVEEAESQEARPKVALSTILAVFVSHL